MSLLDTACPSFRECLYLMFCKNGVKTFAFSLQVCLNLVYLFCVFRKSFFAHLTPSPCSENAI